MRGSSYKQALKLKNFKPLPNSLRTIKAPGTVELIVNRDGSVTKHVYGEQAA